MQKKYTDKEIVNELKRVFKVNANKPYTRRAYEDLGTISKTTVENRFGTWSDALKRAGLYNRFEKSKRKVGG
jgi:hypothetical protein